MYYAFVENRTISNELGLETLGELSKKLNYAECINLCLHGIHTVAYPYIISRVSAQLLLKMIPLRLLAAYQTAEQNL